MLKAICEINSIPDDDSHAIELNHSSLFAIKKHKKIFIYINRCPHMHVPLNWEPNKFLNNSGDLIQCSTHGALFSIETGECLQGPCLGLNLQTIVYEVKDGKIYIEESDLRQQ
jgi:nitrite reductase/ring-hydroxylating ferredoxin subunit